MTRPQPEQSQAGSNSEARGWSGRGYLISDSCLSGELFNQKRNNNVILSCPTHDYRSCDQTWTHLGCEIAEVSEERRRRQERVFWFVLAPALYTPPSPGLEDFFAICNCLDLTVDHHSLFLFVLELLEDLFSPKYRINQR